MVRVQTEKYFTKNCTIFPGGVNSPIRSCQEVQALPLIVDRAYEDIIVDIDDNTYIDFCCSWGALLFGHSSKEIQNAVIKQLQLGTSYGIISPTEYHLAELIQKYVPVVEMMRFVSSGTEATMTAIRLARGYTGRSHIVKFTGNYHGHNDALLIETGSGASLLPQATSKGIPNEYLHLTHSLKYNDTEALLKFFSNKNNQQEVAAVIIEPVAANMGVVPAKREFLITLREITKKYGIVLIFDEVISGFRVARGGASELYGITPDLLCFGKIIGGGFPAAAFGGSAEIMNYLAPVGPVYQAGTLSGNPIAMVAGRCALEMVKDKSVYQTLEEKTNLITKPLKKFIDHYNLPICINQVGSLFTLFFGRHTIENKDDVKACQHEYIVELFHYLLEAGIYMPPSQYEAWFVSTAHTDEHLKYTRDKILEFIEKKFINV